MVRSRHDRGTPVVPPRSSLVDLHSHTTRSDGTMEPAELVRAAAAAGVRILAITDHDNLAAARELLADPRGPAAGFELVPGVEINTVVDGGGPRWGGELHVLGLGVDPGDDAFEAILAAQRDRRRERFVRTLDRLRAAGMPVDDLVAALPPDERTALGRPTVARLLVAKGHARSVQDAFERIVGAGMPGYVPRDGIGPAAAIAAIRAAGGLPVLAHTADAAERRPRIEELRALGLGGLEVHYRRYDAETVASVAAVATSLRLVPTGGSDFHGDGESYAEAHAAIWVPVDDVDALRAALEERAYIDEARTVTAWGGR
ncbi:MAG: PHP domain-containing protein [Candidatus Limnocylindrales bacterium]